MPKTYPHLDGLQVPEELLKLYAYMESPEFYGLDLEIPDGHRKVVSLVGEKAAAQLVPLLQHGSDSMVVAWRQGDSADLGSFPVAWLDSEGSPNAVFARDIRHMLALLHYPVGRLYDIIAHFENHLDDPDWIKHPSTRFTPASMAAFLAEKLAGNEQLSAFHEWLGRELGLSLPLDPCAEVVSAREAWGGLAGVVEE